MTGYSFFMGLMKYKPFYLSPKHLIYILNYVSWGPCEVSRLILLWQHFRHAQPDRLFHVPQGRLTPTYIAEGQQSTLWVECSWLVCSSENQNWTWMRCDKTISDRQWVNVPDSYFSKEELLAFMSQIEIQPFLPITTWTMQQRCLPWFYAILHVQRAWHSPTEDDKLKKMLWARVTSKYRCSDLFSWNRIHSFIFTALNPENLWHVGSWTGCHAESAGHEVEILWLI